MNPSVNFGLGAVVNQEYISDDFHHALDQWIHHEEILRVGVELHDSGTAEMKIRQRTVIPVSIYIKSWPEIMEEMNRIPFHFKFEPPVRIFVKPEGDKFRLFLYFHHLAVDARSAAVLLSDLVSLYYGKKVPDRKIRLLNGRDLPAGSRLSFLETYQVNRLNREWEKYPYKRSFDYADSWRLQRNYQNEHRVFYRQFRLDQSQTASLMKNCNDKKVDTDSAVGAALVSAAAKVQTVAVPVRFISAVNIRKDIVFDTSDTTGNYSSMVSIRLRPRKQIWRTAETVRVMMAKKTDKPAARLRCLQIYLKLDPLLIDSMFFSAFGHYQSPVSNELASITGSIGKQDSLAVSSIGTPDMEGISGLSFFPPAVPGVSATLGITGSDEGLACCLAVCDMTPEQADRLAAEVYSQMLKEIETAS